ncbi:YozE family protein [Solibacillus sp. FSL H8-0538]|uniref:YozE family protein n=1 Tax=Solibacillus sp. FSL H8-0538 TaxID=2921400 RepID=UPI0030F99315
MKKSFYHYVLTFRGGEWSDQKSRFSEAVFIDPAFPKISSSFDELSSYIEMQADEYLTTTAFDELWELYSVKYGL